MLDSKQGVVSKLNPMLTLQYMGTEPENKYFDRKSAKKVPRVCVAGGIDQCRNAS